MCCPILSFRLRALKIGVIVDVLDFSPEMELNCISTGWTKRQIRTFDYQEFSLDSMPLMFEKVQTGEPRNFA